MKLVKAITELINALAPFAWPVLVGLIVWWFRKEIRAELAALIARISKFKGFGLEVETREVQLALENAKAGIPPETIQQAEKALEQAKTVRPSLQAASDARITPRLVESLPLLVEMASTHPREAIKLSWDRLAQRVLQVANTSGNDPNPNSPAVLAAIKQLEGNAEFPPGLIRSIKNLQEIARKVFYQSQFAYDPSRQEAEEFVLYSAAARTDLGEEVK